MADSRHIHDIGEPVAKRQKRSRHDRDLTTGRAELGDDLKVFLATDPSDPAVNVGDDVIVFVSSTNQRGYRVALPFKVLKVIQGAIEPNELDTPFASLHGRSASVVLDSIANNVALGTGPVTAVTQ